MAQNLDPHAEGLFQSQPGKLEPSFREEDQEMAATLKPVVVSPPGYASPNPETMAGRLVPVYQALVPVSEDYGQSVREAPNSESASISEVVNIESTLTPEEAMQAHAQSEVAELDDDKRDEWSKANWQTKARAMGLAESGNKKALRKRVEDAEKEIEDAKGLDASDWVSAIEDAEDADALAELRRVYGAAEVDYATAEKAFADKEAEFAAEGGDGNGDES